MQRMITVLLSAVLAFTMLTDGASARTLTARRDPNDTRRVPDIRAVWTDLGRRDLYIRVRGWEQLRHREVDFGVWLDTRGSLDYDWAIHVSAQWCQVYEAGPIIDVGGDTIGRRQSHRPSQRDVSCRVPARWFGIRKTVRFSLRSGPPTDFADRAPNHGRYVGL
jgi:hypothetical protein